MSEGAPLELWGGIECTINRVGDVYLDQLEQSGHYGRLDDIDRFADIGIRRIRYPVLWERTAPSGIASADWQWPDRALAKLRQAGIEPIVGLVHHGSGPPGTSLVDDAFPERLAEYAAAVAQRYPWITLFTPVNEPLTTARFAGLYGHWYPHGREDRVFVKAVLNQCRAIVLAMQTIRETTPQAGLVQTEDAGSARGTHPMSAQVDFENHRRWLSLDLLTGRIDERHPLFPYLLRAGTTPRELEWFRAHPVAPDVVGLNYYVTSDRYLDHRCQLYPAGTHGGNGQQRYADVDAARVPAVGIRGHAAVLAEAAERYRLPVAITEAHLGCTREEQMRWLVEAWRGAQAACARGIDVRAVTVWSLLGASDWDSLVTVPAGHYEPGVFDTRAPEPRPTALAKVASDLAAGREPAHPVLQSPGWWHRVGEASALIAAPTRAPLLIIGATGTLGRAFATACGERAITFELFSRRDLDITDPVAVRQVVQAHRPWAIVNAAGYVKVDAAERDAAMCRRVNAVGPSLLAAACQRAGIRFVTFSSDLVFDGTRDRPYVESDHVGPLNVYGRTKVEAERRVLALNPDAMVVRTSAFFGPADDYNFVTLALRSFALRCRFLAASDAVVSPTYVPDLVAATIDLLIDGASGLWHLANQGAVSWAELAARAARLCGFDPALVDGCSSSAFGWPAPRPSYSVLGSERAYLLPDLDDSLARYVRERERLGTAA